MLACVPVPGQNDWGALAFSWTLTPKKTAKKQETHEFRETVQY